MLRIYQTTFEVANLLRYNAVIDLSAFEAMEYQADRQIFLDIALQYIYYYARSHREPFKKECLPQNIFILDEIQRFIPWHNYRNKSPESMIGKGPSTLRAYNLSMIFVGDDPIFELPILTNTGILTIFFTKFEPYIISNLLSISKNEYLQLRSLLKTKHDERRCLVSINGRTSLLITHYFSINLSFLVDLEKLQNQPLQRKLQEKYQRLVFNSVEEI